MNGFNMDNVLQILNNLYLQTDEGGVPEHLYNPLTYGLHKGYNVVCSGRGGGKSTIGKVISIISNYHYGIETLMIRASKTETTRAMCKTYFDDLLNITFPDGKNVIQHITNDKYDRVYYYYSEHCYRLGREDSDPDDLKNEKPLCYITSYDKSSDMCSNFSSPYLKLIICEEICDNRITPSCFMDFLHIISTLFRKDTNTYVFMFGNISRGNPDLLCKMEIYERMRTTDIPYFIHKTKEGTPIYVTLFNALPQKDTERYYFNKQYFGFDVAGIDVLKGSAQPQELYRELPEDCQIIQTNYFIYTLDTWFNVYMTLSETWQSMYYIKRCYEPEHTADTITVTDDEFKAYTTPYTYYNCGELITGVKDFLKSYALNDICYENYMCKVAIDTLVRTHK